MSRGLTDEPVQPQTNDINEEVTNVINELIKGQNKLHDRLVDLERKADHKCKCDTHHSENEAADRKFWKKGL